MIDKDKNKKLKSIAFDLDTKALQKYYTKGNWHNAYNDIRMFMEKNNFKHIQGSVYDSITKMTNYELEILLDNLCNKFDWFPKCVKDIRGNDQPIINNLTPVVKAHTKTSVLEKSIQKTLAKAKAKKQANKKSNSKDKGIEI